MSLTEVRKRPGMYIGDTTDGSGLHNMVFELVCNAIKEARSGHADRIDVILNRAGSCTVRDNGRGIPIETHPISGLPAAEIIMTQLAPGEPFVRHDQAVPHELYGVGAAVINALSETLHLRIWRNGTEYSMRFHEGIPDGRLESVGAAPPSDGKTMRGTEITFSPDRTIFTRTYFEVGQVWRGAF